MENKTEKTKKKKGILWYILFAIILLGIFYLINSNKTEEYSYCIDRCISDNYDCTGMMSEYAQSGAEYILYENYEDCFDELEYCTDLCKR